MSRYDDDDKRRERERERRRDDEIRRLQREVEQTRDDVRRVARGSSLVTGPAESRPRTGRATFVYGRPARGGRQR